MKKIFLTFLLMTVFSVSVIFTGCANVSDAPLEGTHSGEKPVTITDMGGDTVTLPETIERVVSTSDPCTDMLVAFGQGDKLIGAYFRALDNPWFKEFCSDFDNIFSFDSYEPEAEALIEMNTDIMFVPSRERAVALREKGICALTIRYYNPDEVVEAAEMLGQIFGGTARVKSDAWISNFNAVREDMSNRLSGIAESDRPVAYEILADKGRGPFRTYYGDNQAWLSYAGGILATKDYADATSQAMPTEEAILATNPDIIFIGGTYATKEYADLLDNEMWENIAAVENGNIFVEPTGATAWNTCSTNYPLLIYYCFSCMYPDKVDFDLKEMAHDFYLAYYEIDFSDEQLDLMFSSKAPDGTELWTE